MLSFTLGLCILVEISRRLATRDNLKALPMINRGKWYSLFSMDAKVSVAAVKFEFLQGIDLNRTGLLHKVQRF